MKPEIFNKFIMEQGGGSKTLMWNIDSVRAVVVGRRVHGVHTVQFSKNRMSPCGLSILKILIEVMQCVKLDWG